MVSLKLVHLFSRLRECTLALEGQVSVLEMYTVLVHASKGGFGALTYRVALLQVVQQDALQFLTGNLLSAPGAGP